MIGEAADAPAAAKLVARPPPRRARARPADAGRRPARATSPRLRESAPGTAIVVLTMQNDPRGARDLLRAGAAGYVLKQAAERQLTEAIRIAAGGGSYVDPELGGALAKLEADPLEAPERARAASCCAWSRSATPTARSASSSSSASARSRSTAPSCCEKLGIESRPELVRFAIANGVIDAGGGRRLSRLSPRRRGAAAVDPGAPAGLGAHRRSRRRAARPARASRAGRGRRRSAAGSKPPPSSSTAIRTVPRPASARRGSALRAAACLTTLFSASWTRR